MSEPFATSAELAAGWRTLTEDESTRADILLARASRLIRSRKRDIDALVAAGDFDTDLVGDIACAMVKRAMQGPVDLDGVQATTETTGPFSQALTFSNPAGDLYLSKSEKASLRIGVLSAGNIDLVPDEDDEES